MNADTIDFHGLPAIRWRNPDGAEATATLQGAHIVSWKPAGGDECLYLSERSPFAAGRAMRGGIPVCFPQFADRGPLPQHGFARVSPWRFAGVAEDTHGTCATFTLEDDERTRAAWPHAFRVELAATVAEDRLRVDLRVRNTGQDTFIFTAALHTYLRVTEGAWLEGLRGCRYVDRGSTSARHEPRDGIPATDAIDRIYFATPSVTRLVEPRQALHVAQRGFTDTVVWNPGPERTPTMPDMPRDGYLSMLCVEAGAIEPAVVLAPGATWSGTQAIRRVASPRP